MLISWSPDSSYLTPTSGTWYRPWRSSTLNCWAMTIRTISLLPFYCLAPLSLMPGQTELTPDTHGGTHNPCLTYTWYAPSGSSDSPPLPVTLLHYSSTFSCLLMDKAVLDMVCLCYMDCEGLFLNVAPIATGCLSYNVTYIACHMYADPRKTLWALDLKRLVAIIIWMFYVGGLCLVI